MNIMQVILIAAGLLVTAGGVLMLVRGARGPEQSPRRAYTPIGMIVMGGLITYKASTEYSRMDTQDVVITSLFLVAMLTLLGLQFFVADRRVHDSESVPPRGIATAQQDSGRANPESSD